MNTFPEFRMADACTMNLNETQRPIFAGFVVSRNMSKTPATKAPRLGMDSDPEEPEPKFFGRTRFRWSLRRFSLRSR
jgi:hypothetical protein